MTTECIHDLEHCSEYTKSYRQGALTSNLKGFPATIGITNSLTVYKSPFHCFLHSTLTKAH
jgi:hypothetical protein